MAGVALENDLAVLVDQHDVWYALDFVLVHWLLIGDDVVLNISPALGCHMASHLRHCLVNTEADDPDAAARLLVAPLISILDHHFLVVRHRSLAGRAPRSPKINKKYISFLVLDGLIRQNSRIDFLSFGVLKLLQLMDRLEVLEFVWNDVDFVADEVVALLVMLAALAPHMHVKTWEEQDVQRWDHPKYAVLVHEGEVEFVWKWVVCPSGASRSSRQILEVQVSLVAAKQFTCDSDWIQNDEEVVACM